MPNPETVKLNPTLIDVNSFDAEIKLIMKFDSVHAILLTSDDCVVLVREKGSDFFNLPGGKPKNNEDPEATLKREFLEEIGIAPCVAYLGELKTNSLSFGLYVGSVDENKLVRNIHNDSECNEIEEIKIISIDELQLLLMNITPGIAQQIINLLN